MYLYVNVRTLRREFQVTNRKMKKYEKEYLLKKEQEAQLEDPVERLLVISCSKHFTYFHSSYVNVSGCKCHIASGLWHFVLDVRFSWPFFLKFDTFCYSVISIVSSRNYPFFKDLSDFFLCQRVTILMLVGSYKYQLCPLKQIRIT